MRLLVTEDNLKLHAIVTKLLSESFYSVDTVGTIDEARAARGAVTYDLILLDLSPLPS